MRKGNLGWPMLDQNQYIRVGKYVVVWETLRNRYTTYAYKKSGKSNHIRAE